MHFMKEMDISYHYHYLRRELNLFFATNVYFIHFELALQSLVALTAMSIWIMLWLVRIGTSTGTEMGIWDDSNRTILWPYIESLFPSPAELAAFSSTQVAESVQKLQDEEHLFPSLNFQFFLGHSPETSE
jgi:hypothetical protein